MIKHIVMWRVGGASPEEILTTAQAIKDRIDTLPGQIKEIRTFEVGLNINTSDSACDLVLVSDFDSVEDLAVYSACPAHQEVVQFLGTFSTEHWTVDYEY